MKRILAWVLALCLLAGAAMPALAQEETWFPAVGTYRPYEDVEETHWAYGHIRLGQETGLLLGASADGSRFEPEEMFDVRGAVVVADRLYQICRGGESIPPAEGGDWFAPYEAYARDHRLLLESDGPWEEGHPFTLWALMLPRILPEALLEPVNTFTDIPDIDTATPEGAGLLRLFRAGILAPADRCAMTYKERPTAVSRGVAAEVVHRIVRPEARARFDWPEETVRGTVTKIDFLDEQLPRHLIQTLDGEYIEDDFQPRAYVYDYDGTFIYVFQPPRIEYVRAYDGKSCAFDLQGNMRLPWREGYYYYRPDIGGFYT